ncbi:hypothetical protein MKW94_018940 [Papaver nudicaule]|uniref:HECT-type E3 ubiquitin transferase n=1 Tax=Papaver nudicaule TaxID=74823 RepID=A0AA41VBJ6_PAPNU|nr:hypothetical protein [Papaver nudicaule]
MGDCDSETDSELLLVWRSEEETQAARDLVSSIPSLCSSCEIDNSSENSSITRARNLVSVVKDFLSMTPTYNVHDSNEHMFMLISFGTVKALVSLVLNSPIQCYKQAGEDSIKLFLYPNIRFMPRLIRKHWVRLVWEFCELLYNEDKLGNQHPLYYSCRKTLVSLLKLMGFRNTWRYVYVTEPSETIEKFFPFVEELVKSLCCGLNAFRESSHAKVPTSIRLSIENDVRLLAFFSRYLVRAIEDHVRLKGQSLPLNMDDDFYNQPCYLLEINFFCNVYDDLWIEFIQCLAKVKNDASWPSYLSVLKVLKNFSKLYLNFEEELFSEVQAYQYQMDMLVRLSKRSDDLLWLLEHKNSINPITRDYLLMKMFPEVNFDFEKQHKMLIDRSEILAESFKHLSLGTPKSLRSGLSVEFRNEEAVGYGVLREWIFMICQELFDPKGSLFLPCPSDRRRFFPNPAPVDRRHRNYFAFAGRVIALALMHKVQVGISFDRVFFLQLAGGAISLEDIRDADPVMYKSCKTILEMDADIVDSDALGLTFVREFEEFGSIRVVELCPGGNSIIVNSKNREEYVELLIQHCFVKSIADKLSYFIRGFGDILCERGFQKIFFQNLELKDLDLMLFGSGEAISVEDWKAHTKYHGYKENDDQICWFWEVYSYRRSSFHFLMFNVDTFFVMH